MSDREYFRRWASMGEDAARLGMKAPELERVLAELKATELEHAIASYAFECTKLIR